MNIPNKRLYKWIGGKNWLSTTLKEETQKSLTKSSENIDIYLEPFIGGLGSFLSILPILLENNIKKFILNDINSTVINLLREIREDPNNLIKEYTKLENTFYSNYPENIEFLHTTRDKVQIKILLENANNFFKEKKEEFNKIKLKNKINKEDIKRLNVLFLFLMQNSFNGVYRENLKGEFNTPFNWNNKKNSIDKVQVILDYHNLFNELDIVFENMDIFEFLKKYKKNNSFIYLDPPYINKNEKENRYNKDTFNLEKQNKLLNELKNFKNYIYSNHSLEFIVNYFNKQNNCSYIEVQRRNIMTSKKENRSNTFKEILGIKIT